jgi:hypothetical protein
MAWAFTTERPSTERFVLVALAEHADDDGVCWPGVERLAERTGFNRATVQRALARLEVDGLVSRQERCVPGGRQTSNLYVLSLDWRPPVPERPGGGPRCAAPPGFSECTESGGGGPHSAAPEGRTARPLEPSYEPSKEPPCPNSRSDGGVQDSKPAGRVADPEDMRLAQWMFALVLGLHPKHKPPNWAKWANEVRLMRERDKRDRRAIAALFKWANAHPFWCSNILSPAKLREKWDQLEIRRKEDVGRPGVPGAQRPPPAPDHQCAFRELGARCTKAGVSSVGTHASSPWYCGPHLDRVEMGDKGESVEQGAVLAAQAPMGEGFFSEVLR